MRVETVVPQELQSNIQFWQLQVNFSQALFEEAPGPR